ncbi:ribonuclease domain-containing protein [Pseudazoarcus pumilus]|uniref:ribonuclease domain-containing protein n=1 Tax=Pseudazoarcus pumilus TaxID=2067960 RepID=UPI0026A5F1BA
MSTRLIWRLLFFSLLCAALLTALLPERIAPPATLSGEVVTRAQLPAEGVQTLDLILRGGPFPYRKDGSTFHNREGLLPDRPRGHYREYTVPTPGSPDRGARRIVTGGDPPEVFYYTADHYRSFRRIGDAR